MAIQTLTMYRSPHCQVDLIVKFELRWEDNSSKCFFSLKVHNNNGGKVTYMDATAPSEGSLRKKNLCPILNRTFHITLKHMPHLFTLRMKSHNCCELQLENSRVRVKRKNCSNNNGVASSSCGMNCTHLVCIQL